MIKTKISLKYLVVLIISFAVIALHGEGTEDVFTSAITYFVDCDLAFSSVSQQISKVSKLNTTDKILVEFISNNPQFEYLLRTNSKGKIISKVTGNKVAPRDYRYIGKQTWFKVMELSKKPYYGSIKQKRGMYLFWNKPLLVYSRNGSRFGGTIAAKINLKNCFSDIADQTKSKFRVMYRKKTIYSNIGENTKGLIKNTLAVYGLPGMTIEYRTAKATPAPAVSTTKTPVQTPESTGNTVSKKSGKSPGKVKKPATKEGTPAQKTDVKASKDAKDTKKGGGFLGFIFIFIIIIVAVLVVGFCIMLMKKQADKRKKFLEDLDNDVI